MDATARIQEKEEHLLAGPLEPTNAAHAIAKIAGIQSTYAWFRENVGSVL